MSVPGILSAKREKIILWFLALTQFTVTTDYMIMMPLGPQITHAFGITPSAFALTVSLYTWCAALSSLLAATYVDRFDRKRLLLVVYALFALSNLVCAIAYHIYILFLARAFAGLTGGILFGISMAIVADIIPASRRGAATGIIATSFSIASIAGVPMGLLLSNHFGWESAFYLIFFFALLLWISNWFILPALKGHITKTMTFLQVFPNLYRLITRWEYCRAFILTAVYWTSQNLIVPFISLFFVANIGISQNHLFWLYLCGGLCTFFTARAIGNLSDKFGKQKMFSYAILLSIIPIVLITHLSPVPLWTVMIFFALFMIIVSGRSIPMNALISTVPDPSHRGAFMSINSAGQQFFAGIGGWVGGLLLNTDSAGKIVGFGINGWVAVACILFCVLWVNYVKAYAPAEPATESA